MNVCKFGANCIKKQIGRTSIWPLAGTKWRGFISELIRISNGDALILRMLEKTDCSFNLMEEIHNFKIEPLIHVRNKYGPLVIYKLRCSNLEHNSKLNPFNPRFSFK